MDFPPVMKKRKLSTDRQIPCTFQAMSPIIPLVPNREPEPVKKLKLLPSSVQPIPLSHMVRAEEAKKNRFYFENTRTSCEFNISLLRKGAESFDWVLCYSDDIYQHWRRIEQNRAMVKNYPNMTIFRPLLINIVRDLQENYGLANTTLHLAVYILDYFLSRNSETIEFKLLVVTALLVAAKVEDTDMRVPRFTELNRTMLNNAFSLIDYRKLEAKILICLDFSLTIPTIATFANFFSRISVVLEDFHIHQQNCDRNNKRSLHALVSVPDEKIVYALFERYDEMLAAVNQLLQLLVDYTLENASLLNVLPSRKAAACIAAARLLYNVKPVWTPFLEMQSCYSESDIRPVMEVVISIYDMHVSNHSSSCDSSPTTDNNNSSSSEASPLRSVEDTCVTDSNDSGN